MLKSALFLSAAVVINVVVSLLMKQSSRADKSAAVFTLGGAVLLATVTALCYSRSLTRINLSVAYPVFAAGSIVLISVVSAWLFRETISVRQVLGMAVIIAGMVLVCAK